MELAFKTIETLSRNEFKGDPLLAYAWNTAAAITGRSDVPSRAKGSTEADLRADLAVILARPDYADVAELQSLRAT